MDSSALNHLLSRQLYARRILAAERARVGRTVATVRVVGSPGGYPRWHAIVKTLGAMLRMIRRAVIHHPLSPGPFAR
jgi:hypothetical protein